jgi:hypothetical protein
VPTPNQIICHDKSGQNGQNVASGFGQVAGKLYLWGGKNEKVELFHLTDRLDFSDSIVMYSE